MTSIVQKRYLISVSILFLLLLPFSIPLPVMGDAPLEKGIVVGGNITVLVIPVTFKDLNNMKDLKEIENRVFIELNDYFQEVSYGRLHITGSIASEWYQLSRPMNWYGEREERWESLIYDAIRAADPDVNYRDYSYIMIVHAGDDQNRSLNETDITSFGTQGRALIETFDGRFPLGVSCLAELDPLGPYAHYLALNLGLPYLHHNYLQIGEWDLMAHGFWANNGATPVHPTSIAKRKVGWLDDEQLTIVNTGEKETITVEILEKHSSNIMAVKIPVSDEQYFMIEAREKTGYDKYLPDEGILIIYVDDSFKRGRGTYHIVDTTPQTETLDDAILQLNQWYINQTASLAVTVTSISDHTYEILVDRTNTIKEAILTLQTDVPHMEVSVDGVKEKTNSSGFLQTTLISGEHTLTLPEKIEFNNETALIFKQWDDGSTSTSRKINIEANTNLSLSYEKKYLVEVESPYGQVEGEGWYTASQIAQIKVQPEVNDNRTRYVFKSWDTGDESPQIEIIVNEPKKLTAFWDTLYQLTIIAEGLPYGSQISLTLQGEDVNVTTPLSVNQWFLEGETIQLEVPLSVESEQAHYKLKELTDNQGIQYDSIFEIHEPTKLTAVYVLSDDSANGDKATPHTEPLPNPTGNISEPIEAFFEWFFKIIHEVSKQVQPSN